MSDHTLVRATVTPQIVTILSKYYGIGLDEALRRFFISIGMPKNFAELGAKEADIPKLVESLCRGNGRQGSLTGFTTLNEEDCTKIYQLML